MKGSAHDLDRRQVVLAGSVAALSGCASMSPALPSGAEVVRNAAFQAICNDPAKPLASLTVLSLKNGQVAFSGGYGRARIGSAGAKPGPDALAAPDTLYRIASISKLLTTLGLMRLVEQGKLDLDADCNRYLGWNLRNPHFPNVPITLRQMLTHQSSLRDDGGYFWPEGQRLQDVLTPGAPLYGKGGAWASIAQPGVFFQYANLPWGVIGQVMECASGLRFDRLMQQELFGPLGIDGGFNPAEMPAAQLAKLATLYRKRQDINGTGVWNPLGPWVPQVDDYSAAASVNRASSAYVVGSNGILFGPQGNARASAIGLGVVAQMLISGGMHQRKPYLKADTVAAMLKRQWTFAATAKPGEPGAGDSYQGLMRAWGLGNQQLLDVRETRKNQASGDRIVEAGGYTALGHLGNAWGLTSALLVNPAQRNALVFLVGGPGFDPDAADPGRYSSFFGYEERILTALYSTIAA